ncbi:hypothetical protein GCM10007082_29990 [Oceanisphaera arctica]|nr:hypothetical protein GCM10007082_29990 [Oceanisphaera arctica]
MGIGDWGLGTGDWGLGNGEWGLGNGEWRMENGEWGMVIGDWGLVFCSCHFSRRAQHRWAITNGAEPADPAPCLLTPTRLQIRAG